MSQETREAAETAGKYLKEAEKHLKTAGEYAEKSKDGGLVKKVDGLREGVKTTHEEITKKLGKDAAQKGQ